MPTTLYTKEPTNMVSYEGKQYPVKDGQVEVPDAAAPILIESHGFSKTAPVAVKAAKAAKKEEVVEDEEEEEEEETEKKAAPKTFKK